MRHVLSLLLVLYVIDRIVSSLSSCHVMLRVVSCHVAVPHALHVMSHILALCLFVSRHGFVLRHVVSCQVLCQVSCHAMGIHGPCLLVSCRASFHVMSCLVLYCLFLMSYTSSPCQVSRLMSCHLTSSQVVIASCRRVRRCPASSLFSPVMSRRVVCYSLKPYPTPVRTLNLLKHLRLAGCSKTVSTVNMKTCQKVRIPTKRTNWC